MSERTCEITLIDGVAGMSLYLDNTRIAGPKPWGGGKTLNKWTVSLRYIADAIPELSEALAARMREEGRS